jgi:hypothetical protein
MDEKETFFGQTGDSFVVVVTVRGDSFFYALRRKKKRGSLLVRAITLIVILPLDFKMNGKFAPTTPLV